jgi:hypothetical protein
MIRNVLCHDRASRNHCPLSDRQARKHNSPGTNSASSSERGLLKGGWVLSAPGAAIVCKNGCRTNEDIILDKEPVPEVHPALDGDAMTDDYLALDKSVVTDVAVIADLGS